MCASQRFKNPYTRSADCSVLYGERMMCTLVDLCISSSSICSIFVLSICSNNHTDVIYNIKYMFICFKLSLLHRFLITSFITMSFTKNIYINKNEIITQCHSSTISSKVSIHLRLFLRFFFLSLPGDQKGKKLQK